MREASRASPEQDLSEDPPSAECSEVRSFARISVGASKMCMCGIETLQEARHPHGRLSSTATPQAQCGGQWFGRPLSDFGSWLASRSSWKSWGLPCCSYCRPVPDTAIGQTWTCSRHQNMHRNKALPWGTRLDHLAPEIRSCVPLTWCLLPTVAAWRESSGSLSTCASCSGLSQLRPVR